MPFPCDREMDENPRISVPGSADLAREANSHILALAKSLTPRMSDDDRFVGFFCECGCWGDAPTTLAAYESEGGAWIRGHKPE